MKPIDEWVRTCLHKKPLTDDGADSIIKKAKADSKTLYKYYCPHCFHWHLTKQERSR